MFQRTCLLHGATKLLSQASNSGWSLTIDAVFRLPRAEDIWTEDKRTVLPHTGTTGFICCRPACLNVKHVKHVKYVKCTDVSQVAESALHPVTSRYRPKMQLQSQQPPGGGSWYCGGRTRLYLLIWMKLRWAANNQSGCRAGQSLSTESRSSSLFVVIEER